MTTKNYIIVFATFLLAIIHAGASLETEYIDEQLNSIQTEFNVQVHYQYDTNLFFPHEWQTPALALSASEIDTAEVTRLIPIIQRFLAAHPISVVRADLEHIYLLRELSFLGKPYGGTHKDKSMYIICDGVANRYDDEFILRRLHSEFSSILRKYHTFPTHSWIQLNPVGFTYSGNGFEMVDRPSRYDFSEHTRSEGFLLVYSQSSLENDFNMISAWLFTKKSDLDNISQRYEKIHQKQTLAEQFYFSISELYSFD